MNRMKRLPMLVYVLVLWGLVIRMMLEKRGTLTLLFCTVSCLYLTYLAINQKAADRLQEKHKRHNTMLKEKFGRCWWLVQNGWPLPLFLSLVGLVLWPNRVTILLVLCSFIVSVSWVLVLQLFYFLEEERTQIK